MTRQAIGPRGKPVDIFDKYFDIKTTPKNC